MPAVHVSNFRDRHGRGLRGPLFYPGTPAWRTRRERFDDLVVDLVAEIAERWPAVSGIEFGVEDVPPSDPAPWEDYSVVLCRAFPADARRGLKDRIVVYRRPVEQRGQAGDDVVDLTRSLLIDRISRVLAISPEELDTGRA